MRFVITLVDDGFQLTWSQPDMKEVQHSCAFTCCKMQSPSAY